MLHDRSERENVFLRSQELSCCKEQSTKRDENIASPAPRPTGREVRQTGGQRRHRLCRVNRCRLDLTVKLYRHERKVVREAMAFGNELGHLFHRAATCGLVCLGDDDRKVLGAEVCWHGLLDTLEALLEPLGGDSKVREDTSLPTKLRQ